MESKNKVIRRNKVGFTFKRTAKKIIAKRDGGKMHGYMDRYFTTS